ncbi:hypothetical protein Daura_18235 [Dactylosporangium aurantiacum]|uniref:SHOCT domain-containing protein n=1 Tax=Dactylosporangium aurantiacum TaxID=35754 RepID=A0A9Q9IR78_9ACTN|nr:hypothetical protein [Dactylosporangium aurantiacum]MDG6105891.1 hypothetical protein [Dactylosporangium aurantiacum]UWZ57934.1 hypothetical protein Daura_18235 [Dactylosporangium aurantiacum]
MMHTLIVTAVVLLVYGAAGIAVLVVYRAGTGGPGAGPGTGRGATRAGATRAGAAGDGIRMAPAGPVAPAEPVGADDPLEAAEADAARRLVAGRLDAAEYRRIMTSLAARDADPRPVTGPEPPRQDDGPGLR